MVLVLDALQDLSHKSRLIITVCRHNGGNILSVTKAVLARSSGCVGVQGEFLKAYTPKWCYHS